MSNRRHEKTHSAVVAAAALASLVMSLLVGCDLIKREQTSRAKTAAPEARSGGAATVGVKIGAGPAVATTETTATNTVVTQPAAPETTATATPSQQAAAPASPPTQSASAQPAGGKAPPGATNPTPRPKLHLITYVDGGDSDRNSRALATARRYLAGARRVAIHGSGDRKLTAELRDYFRKEIRNVSLSDKADVVIDFMGRLDHPRGKKRRTAIVTVSRDDQEIFRYKLGPEEYRVGDDPAEAFSRVASDLFER
jgi:hypothetical protein